MSIREQAWQAFTSQQSDAIDQARDGLLDVLAGLDVVLDLAGVQGNTFVFTDGDVHLATYMDGDVRVVKVVEPDPSGWREVSPAVGSLAELSPYVPPEPPDGDPDLWVSGNVYQTDDVVSHDGSVWRSTVDNNVWEPGVAHSVWVLV